MSPWWLVPLAYLAGSVPWGLIIVKVVKGVDVRRYGSGKTGMTNVLRTAGRTAAIVVFAADASKAFAMVSLARLLTDDSAVHASAAAAVIVGHIWPVFAGFRGGRGIVTGMATTAVLVPWTAIVGLGVFIPVVAATRYISLGSVLGVTAVVVAFAAFVVVGMAPTAYLVYAVGCGTLIVWMHRDNIGRLLKGTERKLGQRAESV
ncbi:MAG: glycerol-3-phosphate 1-O-acyltransferase PlsY [SAR202 cluster bacterium]|nr:glycerol-3-phosphate 1-O-acyltransferase PlsY [SAR202 cluster bacterium]